MSEQQDELQEQVGEVLDTSGGDTLTSGALFNNGLQGKQN